MDNNIRPEWPALPSNPPSSRGAVPTVGGGPDPQLIRPQHPPKPNNPPSSMGDVSNVGGGPDPQLIRPQW